LEIEPGSKNIGNVLPSIINVMDIGSRHCHNGKSYTL